MANHEFFAESEFMAEALGLAREGIYLVSPNPRVGCVLVDAGGVVIGRGATQREGGHAVIMALRDARQRGLSLSGCTAYITMEPCSHHGHAGTCCDALIGAGVMRVVASLEDPNPLVAGRGFSRLRAAGVAVEVGLGREESRELNLGFFSRMARKTPWVRIKVAASLDGITALHNGSSQWITGPEARADGHRWRARACVILTGIGTVLADDPRLDVRGVTIDRQPRVAIVDSTLQLPVSAALFETERSVYVYTAVENQSKRQVLEACGATVVVLPNSQGQVDLTDMLHDLAQKEINEVHVESGSNLNGALVREGLVDELVVYLAPKLLCAGWGMFMSTPLSDLSQARALNFRSLDWVGKDLRILARVSGREDFV